LVPEIKIVVHREGEAIVSEESKQEVKAEQEVSEVVTEVPASEEK